MSCRELDPIRGKIEFLRSPFSGTPPLEILTNKSYVSPAVRPTIAKWLSIYDTCFQRQTEVLLASEFPSTVTPLVKDNLVLLLRATRQKLGTLTELLYEGRLTYGEYAKKRVELTDQFLAALQGGAQPTVASQPSSGNSMPTPVAANSRNEIPLGINGGIYTAPVTINGAVRIDFLIDSGASNVVIPEDVVLTLIRAGTITQSDLIGAATYVLADGSRHRGLQLKLRELKIGDRSIRNVMASVSPARGDPLLGQSFLGRFGSWTLDNRRNVLILAP